VTIIQGVMAYLPYAVWAIAAFFILSWSFVLVVIPRRMSKPNFFTLVSWWVSAGGAAAGFYSVYHLLWLMPLAVVLGSLGIIDVAVIGAAIGLLAYFSRG